LCLWGEAIFAGHNGGSMNKLRILAATGFVSALLTAGTFAVSTFAQTAKPASTPATAENDKRAVSAAQNDAGFLRALATGDSKSLTAILDKAGGAKLAEGDVSIKGGGGPAGFVICLHKGKACFNIKISITITPAEV
jgi:hypothetical protein